MLLLVTQGLDQDDEPWLAVPRCQWCQTFSSILSSCCYSSLPRASTRDSVGLSWRHSPVSLLFPFRIRFGMRLRLAPTHADAACAPWRTLFQQSHPSTSPSVESYLGHTQQRLCDFNSQQVESEWICWGSGLVNWVF